MVRAGSALPSIAALLAALLASPALGAPLCTNHQPERQVFWGDLHVHTGISMDAA